MIIGWSNSIKAIQNNITRGEKMKKATLGAFAMVLVGTVTFTFTNALLADHSTKKMGQTHAPANFQSHKSVDGNNQSEQTMNDQNNSAGDGKDVQTLASLTTSSANQTDIGKSEQPIAVNQQNTIKISSPATSSSSTSPISTMTKANNTSGTTSTKTTASSVPAANQNSAPTVTTSTNPVTAPAQTISTTTTTTNHGQQIAQAAKEKAASQQIKK
jgi:hypothetical protein